MSRTRALLPLLIPIWSVVLGSVAQVRNGTQTLHPTAVGAVLTAVSTGLLIVAPSVWAGWRWHRSVAE